MAHLVGVLFAFAAGFAPPPPPGLDIEHAAVSCIVAERSPQLEARVQPGDRMARARVFFHADGAARWYFVEMKAVEDRLVGVLPRPLKTTRRIQYYIEAVDRDSSPSRTEEYAPRVVAEAGECGDRLVAALAPGAQRVTVHAAEGKADALAGFEASSVAGLAGGGGLSVAWVLGGVAAAGAGVAVAAGGGGESGGGSGSQALRLDGDWFPTLSAGGVVTGQGGTQLTVSGTTMTSCVVRVPFAGCPVEANTLSCSNTASPGSISSSNLPVPIQGNTFTLTVNQTYNGSAPAIVDQLQVTMTGTFASSNQASGTFTGSWVRTGVTPFSCPTSGTWTASR